MTANEQRQLIETQERIVRLTAELRREEGRRDELLRRQLDHVGAHDQRYTTR